MGAFHREQHTAKFNTHQLLLLPLRPLRPLRSLRPLRLKPFGCGSPRCGEELDLSHGTSLWKDAQGLIAACVLPLGKQLLPQVRPEFMHQIEACIADQIEADAAPDGSHSLAQPWHVQVA